MSASDLRGESLRNVPPSASLDELDVIQRCADFDCGFADAMCSVTAIHERHAWAALIPALFFWMVQRDMNELLLHQRATVMHNRARMEKLREPR